MMEKRFIILVLDSVGAGAAPDAETYGCPNANTLGHVVAAGGLSLPCLEALGLGNILPLPGIPPQAQPKAAWGKMRPIGAGMDTTSGHWEIAGTPLRQPLPTYPHGFPKELLEAFTAATGRGILGNLVGSGVEIIQALGEEQLRTGDLILYTSVDSVFQLAAHEESIPPEQLYEYCCIARKLLRGDHAVGRVIARPFLGNQQEGFVRTENRRDFSLEPPAGNLLEACQRAGLPVTAIGKIRDIFAGQHMDSILPGHNNQESMSSLLQAVQSPGEGLIFANFVDFDTLYGHRNDVEGYGAALVRFDQALPQVLSTLGKGDILAITADHGNDPSSPSSDHSREFVPLLLTGPGVLPVCLGIRGSFADLGQTAADYLGLSPLPTGASFLKKLFPEKGADS